MTLALLQQNQLTQQDQLATAYGNMVQGLVQAYQALGGGWQIRLEEGYGNDDVADVPAPKEVPDVNPNDLPQSRRADPEPQRLAVGPPLEITSADAPKARIGLAESK